MPGWHEKFQPLVDAGELAFVGLIQEQHPDRCALFLQWKQMEMPVLIDALNRIEVSAVPLLWAIDEHGIVRAERANDAFLEKFLETDYPPPEAGHVPPDEPQAVADYLAGDYEAAIRGFSEHFAETNDPATLFRLGCAYRARFDVGDRQPGDAQMAVRSWTHSLKLGVRNYIWMRRIQQYGPSLEKPYPFYDWVAEARREIRARGGTPVPLVAEPEGAELARPERQLAAVEERAEPDPESITPPDEDGLVEAEIVVAPSPVAPGKNARVTMYFRPRARAHWANDAGPLVLWVAPPSAGSADANLLVSTVPETETSVETRILDFQVAVPEDASGETFDLSAYALYFVCEDLSGVCFALRRDLEVRIPLSRATR